MTSDFYIGKLWKTMMLGNVVLPPCMAATSLLNGLDWWRILLALGMVGSSCWSLYFYRRAVRTPVISFREDSLAARPMYERGFKHFSRSEIAAVEWSNPQAICLRLKSGESTAVDVTGLDRQSRDTVVAKLQCWPAGAY